jgi:hypothetical protein
MLRLELADVDWSLVQEFLVLHYCGIFARLDPLSQTGATEALQKKGQ